MAVVHDLPSTVSRVDIYRSCALVTRRAGLALPAGTAAHQVRVGGLPFLLDDSSVRLTLPTGGAGRVADVHVELEFGGRAGPSLTELESRLFALDRERAGLAIDANREVAMERMVASLVPSDSSDKDLPEHLAYTVRHQAGSWLDLASYVRETVVAIRGRFREIQIRLKDVNDRIASVHDQISRQSESARERLRVFRKAVIAQVETDGGACEAEAEVSYIVPGVCWYPEYELRVEEKQEQAELVLRALVAQATGEDWPAVELSLCTSDLERSCDLPELDSWRIGRRQPAKKTGWRELKESVDELFSGYDQHLQQLPAPQAAASVSLPSLDRIDQAPAQATPEPVAEPSPVHRGRRSYERAPAKFDDVVEEMSGGLEDFEVEAEEAEDTMAGAGVPVVPLPPPSVPMAPSPAMFAAAPMPPPGMAASKHRLAKAKLAATPVATQIGASRKALNFGGLAMVGPGDRRLRGRLKAGSWDERLAIDELPPELRETDARRELMRQAEREAKMGVSEIQQLSRPAHAVPVRISAGSFPVRYRAESPGQVQADAQLHSIALQRKAGEVQYVYRCVPSLDSNVYRFGIFGNNIGLPLLSGPVRVFSGGDFLVEAALETTAAGAPIDVSLGVEPALVVARNTQFQEAAEGLLRGDTALKHRVSIEVRSKLPHRARVEIYERIPTSATKEIRVELLESSPKAELYDQSDRGRLIHGGLRFSLWLEPGETRTCTLAYQITLPAKQALVGGNRRD